MCLIRKWRLQGAATSSRKWAASKFCFCHTPSYLWQRVCAPAVISHGVRFDSKIQRLCWLQDSADPYYKNMFATTCVNIWWISPEEFWLSMVSWHAPIIGLIAWVSTWCFIEAVIVAVVEALYIPKQCLREPQNADCVQRVAHYWADAATYGVLKEHTLKNTDL